MAHTGTNRSVLRMYPPENNQLGAAAYRQAVQEGSPDTYEVLPDVKGSASVHRQLADRWRGILYSDEIYLPGGGNVAAPVLRRYMGRFGDNGHSGDIRALRSWRKRGYYRRGVVHDNAPERRYGGLRGVKALADYPGAGTSGAGVYLFKNTEYEQDQAEKE